MLPESVDLLGPGDSHGDSEISDPYPRSFLYDDFTVDYEILWRLFSGVAAWPSPPDLCPVHNVDVCE